MSQLAVKVSGGSLDQDNVHYHPLMTAAHAHEYEVPEHSPAPVEAVEQAEGGQVVYLTRAGQRVAAVVPPEQPIDQQAVEAVAQLVTDLIRLDPARARDTILNLLRNVPAPTTATQERIREELIDFLDDVDAGGQHADTIARWREGVAETVPWEQVKAGLDL